VRIERAVERRITGLRDATLRTGTVLTATSSGRIAVVVDGATMNLPRLASYAPTAGDVVQILAIRPGAWLVLGKTA
jgi:hypothetical protein